MRSGCRSWCSLILSQRSGAVKWYRGLLHALAIVNLLAQEADHALGQIGTDGMWVGFKRDVSLMVLEREAQAERRVEVSRFEELWEEWE